MTANCLHRRSAESPPPDRATRLRLLLLALVAGWPVGGRAQLYVNDGQDGQCYVITDGSVLFAAPGVASTSCSAQLQSQTSRAVFYGSAGASGLLGTGHQSRNLSLGGELHVNSGQIGLGATSTLRMGNAATLAAMVGDSGIAIGTAQAGGATLATGTAALAIGAEAWAKQASTVALGSQAVATHAGDVALGANAITGAAVGTPGITLGGAAYSFAGSTPVSVVSIGTAGAERQLTHLAAGRVSATSTDGVNGSQLHATNQALTALQTVATATGDRVNALGASAAAVLGGSAAYDGANGTLSMGNVGGTGKATVHEAIDAVRATASLGWQLQTNGDAPMPVAPGAALQLKDGQNIRLSSSGTAITIATADALTATSLTTGAARLNTDGLVLSGGPSVQVTGIHAGDLKLTGVAPGTLAAGSTEAVNGAQLHAVAQTVAQLSTAGASHGSLLVDLGTGAAGVVQRGASPDLLVLTAAGGNVSAPGAAQRLSNVAMGVLSALSTDAVNGAQLHTQAVGVAALLGGGAGVLANGSISAPGYSVSGARYTDVGSAIGALDTGLNALQSEVGSLKRTWAATTAVPASTPPAASPAPASAPAPAPDDAAPSQQTAMAVARLESQMTGVVAASQHSVHYDTRPDGSRRNAVVLEGADAQAPVVLSNVAAGLQEHDAANTGQLKAAATATLEQAELYADAAASRTLSTAQAYTDNRTTQAVAAAQAYTDLRFGQLNARIDAVQAEARRAAAVGLAVSSLRFDTRPGRGSVAVGAGVWRGQRALAFGVGYTREDERLRLNVSGTVVQGDRGLGAGLSFTFR